MLYLYLYISSSIIGELSSTFVSDHWSHLARRHRGRERERWEGGREMEGGENGRVAEEVRVPLLVADRGRSAEAAARVARKNSVHLMRGEFVARLPEKVRLGVDPERPFTIDVSRTKDLNEGQESFTSVLSHCLKIGFSLSLFLYIYRPVNFSQCRYFFGVDCVLKDHRNHLSS